MISQGLVLVGAVLTLLAAVGVVRFPDVLTRMHALTKAAVLGLLLVLLGAATALRDWNTTTSLVLAGLLQLVTLPVGANLMASATHRADAPPADPGARPERSRPDAPGGAGPHPTRHGGHP